MVSKQSQFDALVRATSGDLYRFAFWLCGNEALAHDLTQEAYLRAWRSLDNLRETAAAKAWLITILRREHARLYEQLAGADEPIDAVELPEDQVGQPEGQRREPEDDAGLGEVHAADDGSVVQEDVQLGEVDERRRELADQVDGEAAPEGRLRAQPGAQQRPGHRPARHGAGVERLSHR